MTEVPMDKRWAKIETIFNRVLEADENRRLSSGVGGNLAREMTSIRREVESLLERQKSRERISSRRLQ